MEIDTAELVLPDCRPPPLPPIKRNVRSAADVVRNASDLIAFLTAHQLFAHVFRHLCATAPAEALELDDWRRWEGADVVEFARRWWVDGAVQDICRRGCARFAQGPPFPPAPTPTRAPSQPSRWSSQPSAPSPPVLHPPPPHPPLTPLALDKALAALRATLPALASTLAAPPADLARFSAPRFEAFLEHARVFLGAVLGGLLDEPVGREVGALVGEWAQELHGVLVAR